MTCHRIRAFFTSAIQKLLQNSQSAITSLMTCHNLRAFFRVFKHMHNRSTLWATNHAGRNSSAILDVCKQNSGPQMYTENQKTDHKVPSEAFKNWIARVKGHSWSRYIWWTLLDALSSYQALIVNDRRCQWVQRLSTTPRGIRVQL